MKRTIRLQRTYPYPRELVWRALTDRELLAEWLMPNDFAPEVGHAFTLRTDPGPGFDGVVHAKVLQLVAPNLMQWSWRGGPIDTVLTFTLEEAPVFAQRGTRLILEHRGFGGFPAVLTSFILKAGWASMLKRRVPHLLSQLASGSPPGLPAHDKHHSAWARLQRLLAPVLKRARDAR